MPKKLTYKQKFNKKHGFDKDQSHSIEEIAKITKLDKKGLKTIVFKGEGAFFSAPDSVRKHIFHPTEWGMARLYASINPTSKASKVDKSHLIKKTKK